MNKREAKKLRDVLHLVEPWQSDTDYRAEPDLQKAVELIYELLRAK